MHAKLVIRVEISEDTCSVNGDVRTRCNLGDNPGKAWEKLRRGYGLSEGDMFKIGKDIHDAVSASGRRDFLPPDGEAFVLHILSESDAIRNLPFELLNTSGDVHGMLIRQGRFTVMRIKP